jgi:hypothetical protein
MLASLVLSALLTLSPLDGPRLAFPGFAESPWQRGVRYLAIARDVAQAAEAACGSRGETCARAAAALLVAFGTHESGWAPDVESPGGCYRGPGHGARCDGGRAFGYWQTQGSTGERKVWAADRVLAARVALHRAWRSWNACRKLEPALRWSAYAGGRCEGAEAYQRSRELDALVRRAEAIMQRASTPSAGRSPAPSSP